MGWEVEVEQLLWSQLNWWGDWIDKIRRALVTNDDDISTLQIIMAAGPPAVSIQ